MKYDTKIIHEMHMATTLLLLAACSDDAIEESTSITLPPETEV